MQWLYPLLKSHISLSKISGEARSEKRTSYNRTKYKKIYLSYTTMQQLFTINLSNWPY